MKCRVCGEFTDQLVYSQSAPSLTSLMTKIESSTRVYVCKNCGHGQSEDLPETKEFYDSNYRISLSSDEHDQLYAVVDGKPAFRTDRQVELVLALAAPAKDAQVLDYGAAKAATLRKLVSLRPDLNPHVFDVSADYNEYWADWIPEGQTANYMVPESWKGTFDLVTSHFVLEHVIDPVGAMKTIRGLLKPGGTFFMSVPDPIGNPGDLIVVDHVSHFTSESLKYALRRAGFDNIEVDSKIFAGGLVATARAASPTIEQIADASASAAKLADIAAFWSKAGDRLRAVRHEKKSRRAAIYGAGFYGSFIATQLGGASGFEFFVDRNPHIQGATHLDRKVIAPADLPAGVDLIYAGLNPRSASKILADVPEWRGRKIEFVYIDESSELA